jgi:hypothetical protein
MDNEFGRAVLWRRKRRRQGNISTKPGMARRLGDKQLFKAR